MCACFLAMVRQPWRGVATALGITQAQSLCTPQAKLEALRAAQQAGRRVAMIGDGLNDGPVLAGAQVSFAFGQAVPLAQSRADFVVMGGALSHVAKNLGTCKQNHANRAAKCRVGCGLQRRLRAFGCGRLVASLVGRVGHGAQFAVGRDQLLASGWAHRHFGTPLMDILYLLIPLSVVLVFFVLGGLWWAIYRGQFEDIEAEGERILKGD